MGTESTNKNFFYRLIFGNIIDLDGDQPQELMLEQGSQKKISDGKNNYLLLLCGIKVNRKIYQPTEIEAELDIVELIEGKRLLRPSSMT